MQHHSNNKPDAYRITEDMDAEDSGNTTVPANATTATDAKDADMEDTTTGTKRTAEDMADAAAKNVVGAITEDLDSKAYEERISSSTKRRSKTDLTPKDH